MGSKLSGKLNLLHSKYPFPGNTWFPDYLLGFLPQADRLLPELPSECGEKSACGWKGHEGYALGPDEGPRSPSGPSIKKYFMDWGGAATCGFHVSLSKARVDFLTKLSQDKNYIQWRRHMDSNQLNRQRGVGWVWAEMITGLTQSQQGETGTHCPIGQITINGWSFLGLAAPNFLLSPLPVSSPSQQPGYASPSASSWLYLADTEGTKKLQRRGQGGMWRDPEARSPSHLDKLHHGKFSVLRFCAT